MCPSDDPAQSTAKSFKREKKEGRGDKAKEKQSLWGTRRRWKAGKETLKTPVSNLMTNSGRETSWHQGEPTCPRVVPRWSAWKKSGALLMISSDSGLTGPQLVSRDKVSPWIPGGAISGLRQGFQLRQSYDGQVGRNLWQRLTVPGQDLPIKEGELVEIHQMPSLLHRFPVRAAPPGRPSGWRCRRFLALSMTYQDI
jgi:hypothetical protein